MHWNLIVSAVLRGIGRLARKRKVPGVSTSFRCRPGEQGSHSLDAPLLAPPCIRNASSYRSTFRCRIIISSCCFLLLCRRRRRIMTLKSRSLLLPLYPLACLRIALCRCLSRALVSAFSLCCVVCGQCKQGSALEEVFSVQDLHCPDVSQPRSSHGEAHALHLLDAGREAAQHAVGAQASGCRVRNLVWAWEVKKHGIGGTAQRRWESRSFRVADEYSDNVIQLVLSEIIPGSTKKKLVAEYHAQHTVPRFIPRSLCSLCMELEREHSSVRSDRACETCRERAAAGAGLEHHAARTKLQAGYDVRHVCRVQYLRPVPQHASPQLRRWTQEVHVATAAFARHSTSERRL